MTGEIFSAESFLWSCLWQSTIFLVAGLFGSFLFRHHSARAHRVLFLAMMAAVIVPAASMLVKHYELGLFAAEPVVIQLPAKDRVIFETTGIISNETIERSPAPTNEDLHSPIAVSGTAKFPWRSTLLYTWIAASLILAVRLLVTFVLGIRLLGQAMLLNSDKIEQAIHLAKARLGISKDVMIYGSANIHSPVIWCWRRRPVLLVPNAAELSDMDLTGVLCHELAHYKRRDHVAGLLAELTVCFLPWHPLLWLAKSRLINLSEQACDDWVIASGQSGTDYAESLLNLTPEGQMAFVPAVVSSKKGLAGRIHRILKDSCANPRTGAAWALAVCIVTTCLTVGIAFAQTRPAKPKSTTERKEKLTTSLHQAATTNLVKVTGQVIDPQGRPVSGTSVTLFHTKLEYLTDAEGKFVASLVPSDEMRYFFAVHKQRKLVASGQLPSGQQHVEINLVPAKMVSGRVVDPNGRPVSGAQVAPLPMTCFHVLTDSEGRFDVGWSSEWAGDLKDFFLMARHQELNLAAMVAITESTEMVNITLEPGLTLTGTIEDPNGIPIPRARAGLTLHLQASASGYGCVTPVEDVLTGDEGHYELKALPQKQDWIIHASADGYWPNKIETGTINRTTDREEAGAIILKKPILSVSGIVVDGDGNAVTNIPVYLWGEGQPDLATKTDTQGKFSFDKVCRGSINISAKNKTLFGVIETQGGAKDVRIVASPRFEPKPDNAGDSIPQQPSEPNNAGQDKQMIEAIPVEAVQSATVSESKVKLCLFDPSGQPVAGAKVGTNVSTRELPSLGSRLSWQLHGNENNFSNERGEIELTLKNLFLDWWPEERKAALYVLHEERKIGTICEISKDDSRGEIPLTLKPVCHVHGKLGSEGLERISWPLRSGSIYLKWKGNNMLDQTLHRPREEMRFEFWIPAGEYELRIQTLGANPDRPYLSALTHKRTVPIKLEQGRSELDLGTVNAPATKLAELIGKPAPEFGPLQWMNGPPTSLSELRGKVVLLYFGLANPSLRLRFSELIELHNQFADKGLTIIEIYNCNSMEELESKWAQAHKDSGLAQDVPFRVALDGGEPTFVGDFERLGAMHGTYDITEPVTIMIEPTGTVAGILNVRQAAGVIRDMLESGPLEWSKRIDEVYRLKDDKILKRIAPPFIPERKEYFVNERPSQAERYPEGPAMMIFQWKDNKANLSYTLDHSNFSLSNLVQYVFKIGIPDMWWADTKNYFGNPEGPEQLLGMKLPGDWILRNEATPEARARAIEKLVADEFGRHISIRNRTVERDVIVATGQFKFSPVYSDEAIVMFADGDESVRKRGENIVNGTNTIAEFLQQLGWLVSVPVIDRTEVAEDMGFEYRAHLSQPSIRRIKNVAEKKDKLQFFLNTLSEQTSLQFEITREPIEVWFVTEDMEN